MSNRIKIEITKSGLPALWECGGSLTSTGSATLVAGPKGEKLKPLVVRTSGHLACEKHALLPAAIGCLVAQAAHQGGLGSTTVSQITGFVGVEGKRPKIDEVGGLTVEAELQVIEMTTEELRVFGEAVHKKARAYHCRWAYWIGETPIRAAKELVQAALAAARRVAEADIHYRSEESRGSGVRERLATIRPRYEVLVNRKFGKTSYERARWELSADRWRQEVTTDNGGYRRWKSWEWYTTQDAQFWEMYLADLEIEVELIEKIVIPARVYAEKLNLGQDIKIGVEVRHVNKHWIDVTVTSHSGGRGHGGGLPSPANDLTEVLALIDRKVELAKADRYS